MFRSLKIDFRVFFICPFLAVTVASTSQENYNKYLTDDLAVQFGAELAINNNSAGWEPLLNISCDAEKNLIVLPEANLDCNGGFISQIDKNGSFRNVPCTYFLQNCTDWSEKYVEMSCNHLTNNSFFNKTKIKFRNCKTGIHINLQCAIMAENTCRKKTPRNFPINPTSSNSSSNLMLITLGIACCVLIGLLGFAIIRVRRSGRAASIPRSRATSLQAFDNLSSTSYPSTSTNGVLNSVGLNGRNFNVVEMPCSSSGRRIYLVRDGSARAPATLRRHGMERVGTGLSDIAEETQEDGSQSSCKSEVTPLDNCVFNFDPEVTGVILESNNTSTNNSPCTRTVEHVPSDQQNLPQIIIMDEKYDYRISKHENDTNYLKDYGWEGAKHLNLNSSTDRLQCYKGELSTSQITMSDIINDNTQSIENLTDTSYVRNAVSTTDLSNSNKLIHADSFTSLPSSLDVSGIPDIEEVLKSSACQSLLSFADD